MERELDIVIISDVHLGSYSCHAKELLNYLNSIKVKTLVLNGDFIDMGHLKKRRLTQEHTHIIHRILQMAAAGTKVYYITGNKDDILRNYTDFSSGNLYLRNKLIVNLKGKSYWIFHGDVFDVFLKYAPIVTKIGGKGYDWLIRLNRLVNKFRTSIGFPKMSFATKLKNSVKSAKRFINAFEQTALRLAAEQNYDYVICGHIHQPEIKSVDINDKKVTYLNSGDWVENLTALEYNWGKWSIYQYDELDYKYINPKLWVKEVQKEETPILFPKKGTIREQILNRYSGV